MIGASGQDQDGLDEPLLAEINITPFVDVMLVVLIIFMVAAPLMIHGLPLELPKVAAGQIGRAAQPVIVSLTRDGTLSLGTETVAIEERAEKLAALRKTAGEAIVYVRADRGIAYGAVADLLGRLGTAGFTHVSLLTLPAAEAGP